MRLKKPLRWYRFKSIRTAFIIPFVVPLLVVIVILMYLLLNGANQVSKITVETISEQALIQVEELLAHHFSEALQLNVINVKNLESGILKIDNSTNRESYFSILVSEFPEVAMSYVAFPDKRFYGARRTINNDLQVVKNDQSTNGASEYYNIASDGTALDFVEKFDAFDPTTRPWYTKAVQEHQPVFSDVYNHFVFKLPTITASYPVYVDDKLIGVFGSDYLLTWLGESLASIPTRENGMVFITDSSGQLVASSKASDEIFQMINGESKLVNAKDSDNKLIKAAIQNTTQEDQHDIIIGDQSYYIVSKEYNNENLDWKIYILLSKEDVLGKMSSAMRQTVVLVSLSSILFIGLAWLLSRWITRPILNLNMASKRLAEGQYDFISDEIRRDELGQLSRSFNEMAIKLTNIVASLESQVAERTRDLQEMNESLSRLSFSDGLTGLPNRRKFDDFYYKSFSKNKERSRAMTVVMMDLDNFKLFNDTYGHLAGDDCLRLVSAAFNQNITKKKDLIARYGGEEFSAILQGYSKAESFEVCENLRRAIEEIEIPVGEGITTRVTLSLGMVNFIPSDTVTMEEWIQCADQALYKAKSNGKNQTAIDC
ncbi:diguanylate cyclase [Fusibacter bizertensis]|uniref:Diguanylate cyclase n=1 Tax=Fusibacter bizertensis TaxID=1488331 RepID=A0ABT6NA60_9FIRM|nr:diguanylate cyclase [Fusibacter bizertensis]MDH8677289.1 diguanylate cyclase [Fusibacter bizertensis]